MNGFVSFAVGLAVVIVLAMAFFHFLDEQALNPKKPSAQAFGEGLGKGVEFLIKLGFVAIVSIVILLIPGVNVLFVVWIIFAGGGKTITQWIDS